MNLEVLCLFHYREVLETAYQQLQQEFEEAQHSLPDRDPPWFKQIWYWLTRRTEKQILKRLAQNCQPTIAQIHSSRFAIVCPNDRSHLNRQKLEIEESLEQLQELRRVLTKLDELSNQTTETTQRYAHDTEVLEQLNQSLAEPLVGRLPRK